MKVYIIGNRNNVSQFNEAEKLLKQKNYAPVNPLKIIGALPDEITNSDFTLLAYELIRICDAVYFIEGCEKDLFARMEEAQAKRENKKIITNMSPDEWTQKGE